MLGARDASGRTLSGQYKPHEIGQLTVWQLKHVFTGKSSTRSPLDHRANYLYRHKVLGTSAFETWRQWKEQIEPALLAVQKKG